MRLFFLFLFFSVVLFTHAQNSKYQAVVLDKKLTENANAIVRLDEMAIELVSQNKMTYSVRQVVTVLNKRGDRYAKTHVFYDKEKKIRKLEAYVYDKLGGEIDHIKKKDFQDVNAADGFSLYRDDRLLRYRYTPVQYPYTLEFSYEVETSDTGIIPPWYFLLGYNVGVEKSRYSITYATESLKPVIKEHHLSDIQIEKNETAQTVSYSVNHIPAIERESLSPDFADIVPRLSVRLPQFHYKGFDAKVNDWNELGAWIDQKLLQDRTELPEATKSYIKTLVAGVEDDLEKAKIIYGYVQENTRYVSVQIGIGGLRPIRAVDVDRLKYGDCKGLSNYTKALLKAVGVTSFYTVVEAGKNKVDFEDDFSDLRQGNHVILAIPYNDDYYWIDCTSQIHPFGFVGDFTDDRKVLVVKPNGGEIVRTVAYFDEENHQTTKAYYSLSADGSISATVDRKTMGVQYDNRFYIQDYPKEDLIKYYKRYWSNINNLEITEYALKNDRDNVVFREKVSLSASNYGSISGERILLTVNAFNKHTSVPKRYRERGHPFEIQRGYFDEDEYTVQLPQGYDIEALPGERNIDTEFGQYRAKFVHDGDAHTIFYQRTLLIKHGLYSKERYAAYRNFKKKVASADNAQIVLVKNHSK